MRKDNLLIVSLCRITGYRLLGLNHNLTIYRLQNASNRLCMHKVSATMLPACCTDTWCDNLLE